jgi:hypothetical protein
MGMRLFNKTFYKFVVSFAGVVGAMLLLIVLIGALAA